MSVFHSSRIAGLPLALLALAPAAMLAACGSERQDELAAAIERANQAAQRAEVAQHAAEAAAVRAQTDRLAVTQGQPLPEEQHPESEPASNPGAPVDQPSPAKPG